MNNESGTAPTNNQPGGPLQMNRKQRRIIERQIANDRPRGTCPFPDCGKTFFLEEGKPNACPFHRKLIADVIYIHNRIQTPPPVEGPKGEEEKGPILLVPKPGMADQAIKEAAEAAKRKGETKP